VVRSQEAAGLVAFLAGSLCCALWGCRGSVGSADALPTGDATETQTELRVWLVADPRAPLPGSLLCALVLVENAGDRTLTVDGRLDTHAHLLFALSDEQGETLRFPRERAKLRNPSREAFVAIPPGYVWGRRIAVEWPPEAQRGEYSLRVRFQCWEEGRKFGLSAWTGTADSNALRVRLE